MRSNVGGGRGRSCIMEVLAGALLVYSVSIWPEKYDEMNGTKAEFFHNLAVAGVLDRRVNVWEMLSVDAARLMKQMDIVVDFVFIDAEHLEKDVREDMWAWNELLKPGGVMAFHDTAPEIAPGVQIALRDLPWPMVGEVHNMRVYRKPV
jgi:hypothetical protein